MVKRTATASAETSSSAKRTCADGGRGNLKPLNLAQVNNIARRLKTQPDLKRIWVCQGLHKGAQCIKPCKESVYVTNYSASSTAHFGLRLKRTDELPGRIVVPKDEEGDDCLRDEARKIIVKWCLQHSEKSLVKERVDEFLTKKFLHFRTFEEIEPLIACAMEEARAHQAGTTGAPAPVVQQQQQLTSAAAMAAAPAAAGTTGAPAPVLFDLTQLGPHALFALGAGLASGGGGNQQIKAPQNGQVVQQQQQQQQQLTSAAEREKDDSSDDDDDSLAPNPFSVL